MKKWCKAAKLATFTYLAALAATFKAAQILAA